MFRASSPLFAVIILAAVTGPIHANTITVNSNEDTTVVADGKCTLREALVNANTDAESTGGDCTAGLGSDRIVFSIGTGPVTIQSNGGLAMGPNLVIDATTQPGFTGTPIVELDGSIAGVGSSGLVMVGANSSVRGLVINRFSGNGIHLFNTTLCRVTGNYIGTDVSGSLDLGNNQSGILIELSTTCTIGGFLAQDRNIISGNESVGVIFASNSNSNVVSGNYIGVNAVGTAALPNGLPMIGIGVLIVSGVGNTIGGATPGTTNVISGHGTGLAIFGGGTATTIQGNRIGTNAAGTAAIPNGRGVHVSGGGAFSLIGGSVPSARNIISGNTFEGIFLAGLSCHDLFIRGNRIGTNADGTGPLGNSIGILVAADGGGAPLNNTIGGSGGGDGNTLAFNNIHVALLSSGANHPSGIRIQRNSMFGAGATPGIGLDLGGGGHTPNDLNDPDVGPNALQNFPVLTTALTCGATALISGSLNSTPSSAFTLEFFSTPPAEFIGGGRGKVFLGTVDVTTNATGNATFAALVSGTTVGDFITATATSSIGNTSEFSTPTIATGGLAPVINQGNNPLTLNIAANTTCPSPANQIDLSATDADTVPAGLNWTFSAFPTKGIASFVTGSMGQNVTLCYKPNAGAVQLDTFSLRVTDSCGLTDQIQINVAPQGVVNVGPDSLAPVIACPINVNVALGQSSAPAATGTPAAADNLDPAPVVTFTDVQLPRACPAVLAITRTWRATDASGNSSTCQQTIIVLDADSDGDGIRDCQDPAPIDPPVPAAINDMCGIGLCAPGTAMAVPLTLIGLIVGKRRRR